MFALKLAVILIALAIFGTSAALVGYDIYLAAQLSRLLPRKLHPNDASRKIRTPKEKTMTTQNLTAQSTARHKLLPMLLNIAGNLPFWTLGFASMNLAHAIYQKVGQP